MRFDIALLQARHENERRERMRQRVHAVGVSLAVGAAALIFGVAVGLHDARWSDAWNQVGSASFPLSGAQSTGIGARHG